MLTPAILGMPLCMTQVVHLRRVSNPGNFDADRLAGSLSCHDVPVSSAPLAHSQRSALAHRALQDCCSGHHQQALLRPH